MELKKKIDFYTPESTDFPPSDDLLDTLKPNVSRLVKDCLLLNLASAVTGDFSSMSVFLTNFEDVVSV